MCLIIMLDDYRKHLLSIYHGGKNHDSHMMNNKRLMMVYIVITE